MIDPELIEVKQHGKLFLKDIDFKCPSCGCQFSCALKHIIEDASKNVDCEEHLKCNIENTIDQYPTLDNDKYRRVIYIRVPCPECTDSLRHEMIFCENENYHVQREIIPNENL